MTGPKDAALERAYAILHAQVQFQSEGGDTDTSSIIRQYDLGLSPRVKDARSGKSTTRVDRILKGNLDSLLD